MATIPVAVPYSNEALSEVGESTGALPQMLNSVAEFFEEDGRRGWGRS